MFTQLLYAVFHNKHKIILITPHKRFPKGFGENEKPKFNFFRKKERTMNFNVYVIHSAKPLSDLKKALEECGGFIYAGIIYKSLHRKRDRGHITEKEETKKTIVLCPENSVKQLESTHPHYKGKVADYDWKSFPMPSDQHGESWDLHISGVPNDYTVKDAETFVVNALSCILPMKDNFVVEFVPRLRETGEIYGYGHVNFAEHVNHDLIKLCKLVLHNTPVSFKSNPKEKRMVTCVWHRVGTVNKSPESPVEIEAKKSAKNKKPAKPRRSKEGFENVRRARPASTPVRQVDVSNIVAETTPISAKIETITKDGVVATK